MAYTNLANLIQRDSWSTTALKESLEKSVFWNTGLVVSDGDLQAKVRANSGRMVNADYFLDLADDESRVGDDSATSATPSNIDSATDQAIIHFRNNSWGARNITANLSTTGDPMSTIASRVGAYWARQYDTITLNTIEGIFADNVANNASDMVNDQTGVAITINMILDTIQTMGDRGDQLATMVTHSAILTSLRKAGVTDKVYNDQGQYLFDALSGLRIIASDKCPSPAAGTYTSYIIGGGQFGFGEGTHNRPDEVSYDAASGNGAGSESLWMRRQLAIHPYGFSFTDSSVASTSPTNAELILAANWTRNVDRKYAAFAALHSDA